MKPVNIQRLQLDHVLSQDKILFNTNNHWENNQPPSDYQEVLSRCRTRHWVHKFHSNYQTMVLDSTDLNWMKKAARVGMITGRFSKLFEDELENICQKYMEQWTKVNENNTQDFIGWFVRSDRVSLKEGQHGVGPYKDFKSIIESATSCGPGHQFFDSEDTECTIYLFPWLNLNPYKEFRLFVCENTLTAISDQHLYTVNEYLNTLSNTEIESLIGRILDFYEKNIKDKLSHLGNYTIDLGFIQETDMPYFIEPNSFGKLYAAGSALFSWIYDTDALHEAEIIDFRYCHEY